jgi:hypothetical protein
VATELGGLGPRAGPLEPIENLGFVPADEKYGLDRETAMAIEASQSNPSNLIMDLSQNGAIVTGTWSERTNPGGYCQGSVYHGTIQFLLDPTGHRFRGQWVGYGRDFDLNTGPWTLELV